MKVKSNFALTVAMSVAFTVCAKAAEYKPDHPELPRKLTDETEEQKAQRMQWWTDSRFGMFIHFGLYSVPAGVGEGGATDLGEWIQSRRQYSPQFYEKTFIQSRSFRCETVGENRQESRHEVYRAYHEAPRRLLYVGYENDRLQDYQD